MKEATMLRSAVLHGDNLDGDTGSIGGGRQSGAAWAAAVAILFAAIAVASFAVDLSLSLSGPGL